MALSASTVWEVRTTGSDTNGGGYVSGGTDWSQQDSPQYSVTDGVTNGTTTITSATANFGTDVVGNIMYVQGGTGSVAAGWYQIISRTNATTIVVDRSTGLTAGTGVTLKIGGALASPGIVGGLAVGGNTLYIKTGTYTITTSSANVSGGVISTSGAATLVVRGYGVTRGDNLNPPTLFVQAGVTGMTVLTLGVNTFAQAVINLIIDGNSQVGVSGFSLFRTGTHLCQAKNCPGTGFAGGGFDRCYAENCGSGFGTGPANDCESKNCTTGFNNTQVAINCIARGGTTGFSAGGGICWKNCTARDCSSTGFTVSGSTGGNVTNCIATNCTTKGFSNTATGPVLFAQNASYSNGTNDAGTVAVTLSADPFVSSTNAGLNSTAGGGASCLAAGTPGLFPGGTTTGYPDIGAAQHQDSGGGVFAPINMNGGFING
jgi:hypothetical protein